MNQPLHFIMKISDKAEFEKANVFGTGEANVTFEPGCRNNWHIHHATKGGGKNVIGKHIIINKNVRSESEFDFCRFSCYHL